MKHDRLEELAKKYRRLESTFGFQHGPNYVESLRYSLEACLGAFSRYDEISIIPDNADSLINAVQEAIGHAGALSRYFWPSEKKCKSEELTAIRMNRAEWLKAFLETSDDSALNNPRIRNVWEHFDERLDTFLVQNMMGSFMPQAQIRFPNFPPPPYMRIFKLIDPEAECLILLDERYDFGPIRKEVERIHADYFEGVTSDMLFKKIMKHS